MAVPCIPVVFASLPTLINPVSLTATAAGELAPVPTAADPVPPKVLQMSVAPPEILVGAALTLAGMGAQWLLQKVFSKKAVTQPEPKKLPPPAPKEPQVETGKKYEVNFWQLEKVLQRLSALSDVLSMYQLHDEHKFVTKLVRNLGGDFGNIDKACGGTIPEKIGLDGKQLLLIYRIIKAVDEVSAAIDRAFEDPTSPGSKGSAKDKINTLQTAPFVEDYFEFQTFLGNLAKSLAPEKPNRAQPPPLPKSPPRKKA